MVSQHVGRVKFPKKVQSAYVFIYIYTSMHTPVYVRIHRRLFMLCVHLFAVVSISLPSFVRTLIFLRVCVYIKQRKERVG